MVDTSKQSEFNKEKENLIFLLLRNFAIEIMFLNTCITYKVSTAKLNKFIIIQIIPLSNSCIILQPSGWTLKF